ncbi:MAG: 4-hydroxythreonine-4-phosphate dehydrogenase PdxA [Bacteroidota bacterium]
MEQQYRPVIGITIGDINGIGPEVILKTFQDKKFLKYCDIVIYGSSKVLSYYKKALNIEHFDYVNIADISQMHSKQINVINYSNEEAPIEPGKATLVAGEISLKCIDLALADLKANKLDGIVTAPINKSTIKTPTKDFKGHTDYIRNYFGVNDSMMLMVDEKMRIGLCTGHIAIKDLHKFIDSKSIYNKLEILHKSLTEDFLINKPRIAVLGLNPHAGEDGVIGKEEQDIIHPAISSAKDKGILAFGTYPADGFFGAGLYTKFDGILAMYHDQGLIPFKSFAFNTGVNYTAGLPVVRTSPDHGTAYDLVGKNIASSGSMENAVFVALDIIKNRQSFIEMTSNPVKKSNISSDQMA